MANEGRGQISFNLNVENLQAQYSKAFEFDISEAKGPTPGLLYVTSDGVDADLSLLTDYGFCFMFHMEADPGNETLDVDWGIKDGADFYPIGRLKPGEAWPLRLSPNALQIMGTTGTGTTGATDQTLHFRSMLNPANISVEAYEN